MVLKTSKKIPSVFSLEKDNPYLYLNIFLKKINTKLVVIVYFVQKSRLNKLFIVHANDFLTHFYSRVSMRNQNHRLVF